MLIQRTGGRTEGYHTQSWRPKVENVDGPIQDTICLHGFEEDGTIFLVHLTREELELALKELDKAPIMNLEPNVVRLNGTAIG